MPRPAKSQGQVFVAKQSFTTDMDGIPTTVSAGELIREGHPLLRGRELLFEPMIVRYEWEQATAAPGEKRGA